MIDYIHYGNLQYIVSIDGVRHFLPPHHMEMNKTCENYCKVLLRGIVDLYSVELRPKILAITIFELYNKHKFWQSHSTGVGTMSWFISCAPKEIEKSEIEKFMILE